MESKPIIRISVRNLVEFILRAGDIDNRHVMSMDQAMSEGSRIHRKLQSGRGSNYNAEVSLKFLKDCEAYEISVEGRADGLKALIATFFEYRNPLMCILRRRNAMRQFI